MRKERSRRIARAIKGLGSIPGLLVFTIALVSSLSASNVTGRIIGPNSGLPVANGRISFTLNYPAVQVGTAIVAPTVMNCWTDSNGNIVGLPGSSAVAAPVLSANLGSGTLPNTTYFVKLTWFNGTGEVEASTESTLALGGVGTLIANAPTSVPALATRLNVYISTSSGTETLQGFVTVTNGVIAGNYQQSVPLISGAALPSTNTSICQPLFNDTLIPSFTGYKTNILTQAGSQISGYPQLWYLWGASVNVSQGTPISTGIVQFPQPIVTIPTSNGTQTINGPLSLNGFGLTAGSLTSFGPETIAVTDAGVGTRTQIANFERIGAATSSTERVGGFVFSDALNLTVTAGVAGIRTNSATDYNGALGFYVANLGGTPSATLTDLLEVGRFDSTGKFSANNIESMVFADRGTGGDCGAKINFQDTALGANPGMILVNRACGTTWSTAVTISANHHLYFIQSGLFTTSAAITVGQGAGIVGLPTPIVGSPCDNNNGTCIRAANASNLAALVILSGTGAYLRDLGLDGNKANQTTGGVGVKTNVAGRTKLDRVVIENFPSHGWWISSTGTSNQSAVPKTNNSIFLNNGGDGIYSLGTNDFFADTATEFEANGLRAVVNTDGGGIATFVSGTLWTNVNATPVTNTLVQINGIPCLVSAVTSTTFSTTHCRSSVAGLVGATVFWGGGLENVDSGACRITGSDFGGNFGPGIVMYGLGGGLTSTQCQVSMNQFANNFTQDIMVLGDGPGDDQTFTAGEEMISNNTFLNKNSAAQANTFDDVVLRDSQNDVVATNSFSSGATTTRWYVQVTEHAAGVGINENVGVNSLNLGSLGTGTVNCPNTKGCGLQPVNFTFATLPTAAINGTQIFCTDCNATCAAGAGTGRTCFRENGAWTH